mmetsp:Transcript_22230/g.62073  ORF Transcript_22230/g.62073 Transcript_22230/m.62073 type:complete len:253 (+) Transcript_22230:313-1071(+)
MASRSRTSRCSCRLPSRSLLAPSTRLPSWRAGYCMRGGTIRSASAAVAAVAPSPCPCRLRPSTRPRRPSRVCVASPAPPSSSLSRADATCLEAGRLSRSQAVTKRRRRRTTTRTTRIWVRLALAPPMPRWRYHRTPPRQARTQTARHRAPPVYRRCTAHFPVASGLRGFSSRASPTWRPPPTTRYSSAPWEAGVRLAWAITGTDRHCPAAAASGSARRGASTRSCSVERAYCRWLPVVAAALRLATARRASR